MKALIAAHGELFPFTHDLQLLIDQLEKLGEIFPAFAVPLAGFTKFGVIARYDVGVPLNGADRQMYRKIVEDLRVFITGRVAMLP